MNATMKIVDSVATSSLSPEEMLERLDSYQIEWYLTDQGDLMIKSWQVGAEGFVSPEQVERIQAGRRPPREASALEWVSRNLDDLRARYAGRWIAVVGNQVVASATNLAELLEQVRVSGIDGPFITEIPTGPVIWTTAYA